MLPSRPREAKKRGPKVMPSPMWWAARFSGGGRRVLYPRGHGKSPWLPIKAYITQLGPHMIAMEVGRIKGKLADEEYARLLKELERVPELSKEPMEKKVGSAEAGFQQRCLWTSTRSISAAVWIMPSPWKEP